MSWKSVDKQKSYANLENRVHGYWVACIANYIIIVVLEAIIYLADKDGTLRYLFRELILEVVLLSNMYIVYDIDNSNLRLSYTWISYHNVRNLLFKNKDGTTKV